MMELLKYLKWRKDIPFRISPFNEVDNAILSYLAYLDFQELVKSSDEILTLSEAFFRFRELHDLRKINADGCFTERVPLLLEEMAEGDRFSRITVGNYVNEIDRKTSKQFSAVVFGVENDLSYIAFRGTDNTITGWKEDMMMSCTSETEGAKASVEYLNKVGAHLSGEVILGGHSKGGNFAVYGAAFCGSQIKKKILRVYSNDGPGFRDEVISAPEYREILPRLVSIIPESSVIGLLLSHECEHTVVKSTARGIFQHDAATWEVGRNAFIRGSLDESGIFLQKALGNWLEKLDDETRESVVSTVFALIDETETDTFPEFGSQIFRNTEIVLKGLAKLPTQKKQELVSALGNLVQSGGRTVLDSFAREKA